MTLYFSPGKVTSNIKSRLYNKVSADQQGIVQMRVTTRRQDKRCSRRAGVYWGHAVAMVTPIGKRPEQL